MSVRAGMITLMSISDGLYPSIFCQKIERTPFTKEEMDGNVFIFRHSRHFHLNFMMIKVFFPYLYLGFACKHL